MRRRPPRARGFTLIELLLVVALIGVLAALSVDEYDGMLKRTKRVEATIALTALWKAQQAYFADKERYAANFDELGLFAVEGGRRVSSGVYQLRRYTLQLSQPWGRQSYYAIATGQLDSDDWPDMLEMRELTPPGN